MAGNNPHSCRLGYARVSTYGQAVDGQLAQLRAENRARIREKASGAKVLSSPLPRLPPRKRRSRSLIGCVMNPTGLHALFTNAEMPTRLMARHRAGTR